MQHSLLSPLIYFQIFPLSNYNRSHLGFGMITMSEVEEYPQNNYLPKDWWSRYLEKSHSTPPHLCYYLERSIWNNCANSVSAFLITCMDFPLFWLGIQLNLNFCKTASKEALDGLRACFLKKIIDNKSQFFKIFVLVYWGK